MKLSFALTLLPTFFAHTFGYGNSLPDNSNDDLYVVSYSRAMKLSDLVDALDVVDVRVEKQLSCTRGLLVRFANEQDRAMIGALDGITIQGYSSTHAAGLSLGATNTTSSLRKLNNQCNDCNVYLADNEANDEFSQDEVDFIVQKIIANVHLDFNSFAGSRAKSAGELVRLAFHDVAPFDAHKKVGLSGSNGCVDTTHPANFGLASAIDFLEGVREEVWSDLEKKISMADLMALGGSAAVEATGGPHIEMKLGRWDIPCACEINDFPSSEGQKEAFDTVTKLAKRLGLSRRNMVALMGAHTLGTLEIANSGFQGTWVPEGDAGIFSNMYFWGKFCIPWQKVFGRRSFQGVELTEWLVHPSIGEIVFMNTDAILAFRNLDKCDLFGGVNHLPTGFDPAICNVGDGGPFEDPPEPELTRCGFRAGPIFDATVEFAKDQQAFFDEFVVSYKKMVENTVPCGTLYQPI